MEEVEMTATYEPNSYQDYTFEFCDGALRFVNREGDPESITEIASGLTIWQAAEKILEFCQDNDIDKDDDGSGVNLGGELIRWAKAGGIQL